MKEIRIAAILFATTCLAAVGCDDYRDVHKQYVGDGETVYLRMVDSVSVFPGRNRLKLRLCYTDADRLTHTVVSWNDGADSERIDLEGAPSGSYVVEHILAQMPEGAYDLKIRNVNRFDQTSLYTDAFGTTYGERYESSLTGRQVRNVEYLSPTRCRINWMYAGNQLAWCEVKYTGLDGDPVRIPPDENVTALPLPPDWKFLYRSAFMPSPAAIDVFYTEWTEMQIAKPTEQEADYTQFTVMDKKYSNNVSSASCSDLAKLWNRPLAPITTNRFHLENLVTTVPWSASFSMGSARQLTRIVLWQYGWPGYGPDILYNGGNAKTYEFYGSNAPSDTGELDDSWTLFLTATIVKPSGKPLGEQTDQDRDIALNNGHEFLVPSGTAAYEYIRMRCTEKFGDGTEWGHSTKMQVFVKYE